MNWIFDLDFTLYDDNEIDDSTETKFYKSFKRKPLLNKLLKNIKGNKYIFSNGNKAHVEEVVKKMQFKSYFKKIAYSELYPKLKPHKSAYKTVIKLFKIKSNTKIFFFEDTKENLIYAKKLNWNTVYISPKKEKNSYIDYWFPNIETALIILANQFHILQHFIKN